MLDVSRDERTALAWSAANQRDERDLVNPTALHWRRLLAELDPGETVLLLDQLADAHREVYVAVTGRRLMSWAFDRKTVTAWTRQHVQVVEHDTKGGFLKLSDGGGARPLRLGGSTNQRRRLLKALTLPADARPLVPPVPDLRSSQSTKGAFERSPQPPAPQGPAATAIIEHLGRKTALALAEARFCLLGRADEEVVAVVTARELHLYSVPKNAVCFGFEFAGLEAVRAGDRLMFSYDRTAGLQPRIPPSSWMGISAPAPVLDHLEEVLRSAVGAVERDRQMREASKLERQRADADGLTAVPELRRTGIFRRRVEAMPIHSWREAEAVACSWLREMGHRDAALTPTGTDAGVDIRGKKVVAQVKWQGAPTGRPTVQQLAGAAAHERKIGAFFSRAGYTREAVVWAERHGLALFSIDDVGGVRASTTPAKRMLSRVV